MLIRRCTRAWFSARCLMAGKTAEGCERCVVADDGKTLQVDAEHADYPRPGLGDRVAAGLAAVGVTEERVARAVGKPCGCKQRREALNSLGKTIGLS
jgi:hypothetical protein